MRMDRTLIEVERERRKREDEELRRQRLAVDEARRKQLEEDKQKRDQELRRLQEELQRQEDEKQRRQEEEYRHQQSREAFRNQLKADRARAQAEASEALQLADILSSPISVPPPTQSAATSPLQPVVGKCFDSSVDLCLEPKGSSSASLYAEPVVSMDGKQSLMEIRQSTTTVLRAVVHLLNTVENDQNPAQQLVNDAQNTSEEYCLLAAKLTPITFNGSLSNDEIEKRELLQRKANQVRSIVHEVVKAAASKNTSLLMTLRKNLKVIIQDILQLASVVFQ